MSNEQWNWMDELERMAETYTQDFVKKNKPTSFTELLDMFNKVASPSTRTVFDGLVDDPRATDETSTMNGRLTNYIHAYTCPACQGDVEGAATYELVNGLNPARDHEDSEYVNVDLKLIGVRVHEHDCTPKANR